MMSIRPTPTLVFIGFCSVPVFAIPDVPTTATRTFVEGAAGRRAALSGDRLTALYGTVLASDNDSETSTDDFVAAFMASYGDALGVDDAEFGLVDKLNIRNDKFAIYTYQQEIEGLPVHGSVVRVLVRLGDTEKISHVCMHLTPHPPSNLPSDTIDAQDAIDIVSNSDDFSHLAAFDTPGNTDKVIFEAADRKLHRAWRFSGWSDDESWRFFVDTASEAIVGVESRMAGFTRTFTMVGSVELCCHPGRPEWPTCCPSGEPDCCCEETDPDYPKCAEPCCGYNSNTGYSPALVPLSNVELTLFDHSCPAAPQDWPGAYSSNDEGELVCTDTCDGLRAAGRLRSEFVDVRCNDELAHPAHCPSSQDLQGDVAIDFDEGSSTAFCQPHAPTAFYVVEHTHAWLKDLQPTLTSIDRVIPVTFENTNNGGYYFATPPRINLNTSPNDFGPTTTIISHEYGHFLVDQYGLGLSLSSVLGEDLADLIPMFLWDTSCRGYNRRDSTRNQCEIDWNPPLNTRYPTLRTGEGEVRLLAEAFWDLRTTLLFCLEDPDQECSTHGDCGSDGPCIDRKTEELLLDALPCFLNYESIVPALLAVDDDDADLSSDPPTPNYQAIHDSFVVAHGFPDPLADLEGDGSVVVRWDGPGNPQEGTDYFVHYAFTPPMVELVATESGSVEITRWFVGRTLGGIAGDLGSVVANWSGPAHDIVVEIGTDHEVWPCSNIHFATVDAQNVNNWSSLLVDVGQNAFGLLSSTPSEGTPKNGGRVSGTVGRDLNFLAAQAIGSGASDTGILNLGTLKNSTLGGVPQGSSLRVMGDVTETITIDGDLAGDVIADWDADGDGNFLGSVVITGDFAATGNICDADMGATGLLSNRVTIQGSNLGSVCALRSAILPPAPHTAAKNRYLSINPRTNYASELAIKVRLDSMKRCEVDETIPCDDAGDCPSGNCSEHNDVNDEWWVAEPFDASCQDDEYNYLTDPPNCTGVDFVARLSDTAVSLDWSAYPVLHIADCPIVPTATYAITAYDETAEEESTELLISTIARPDSKFYGDVVGALTSNGWTPPQGVVNITDIQAVILAFQGVPTAPHRTWVDIFGPHDGSVPDFHIDTTDLDLVVDAFTGANWLAGEYHLYPGDCPSTKTAIQPIGSAVAFSLDVSSGFIDPEEPVYVDVFIGSVDDLGAYEVALEVTGGTEGWLILTDITVDTQRGDYVFGASSSYIAANLAEARVGNVLASGGVSVTGPKYVATFTYQPSEGATGAFEFAVRDSSFSYLNDCDGRRLAVDAGTNEVIGVGLDCFVNGDCDDFNACTTDTCDDGACVYGNVNQGASCNDGLFCTAVDQCNGQGVCVGGMLTPCTEGQYCDEINDECVGLEQ